MPDLEWLKIPYTPQSPFKPPKTKTISLRSIASANVVITERLDAPLLVLYKGTAYTSTRSISSFEKTWASNTIKAHAWKTSNMATMLIGVDLAPETETNYDPVFPHETFKLLIAKRNYEILGWKQTKELAKELAIDTVPELYTGSVYTPDAMENIIRDMSTYKSSLGPDQLQGLIIRKAFSTSDWSFSRTTAQVENYASLQTKALRDCTDSWTPRKLKE